MNEIRPIQCIALGIFLFVVFPTLQASEPMEPTIEQRLQSAVATVQERLRKESRDMYWVDWHTLEEPAAEIAKQSGEELERYIRDNLTRRRSVDLLRVRILGMALVKLSDLALAREVFEDAIDEDPNGFRSALPLISFLPRDESREILEAAVLDPAIDRYLIGDALGLLVIVGDGSTLDRLKEFIETQQPASPLYKIAQARLEEKLENARLHADIDWEEQEMLLWRVMHDRPSHIIPTRNGTHAARRVASHGYRLAPEFIIEKAEAAIKHNDRGLERFR